MIKYIILTRRHRKDKDIINSEVSTELGAKHTARRLFDSQTLDRTMVVKVDTLAIDPFEMQTVVYKQERHCPHLYVQGHLNFDEPTGHFFKCEDCGLALGACVKAQQPAVAGSAPVDSIAVLMEK